MVDIPGDNERVEKISAELEIKTAGASRGLKKIDKELDHTTRPREAEITTDVDDSSKRKSEAELSHLSRDREVDLEPKVNKADAAKSKLTIRSLINDAVQENRKAKKRLDRDGGGLGGLAESGLAAQGFEGIVGSLSALKIPAALSAGGPLASGVSALGAGATSLLAPLGNVAVSIAALPGLVVPAAGAFAAFKASTSGLTNAMSSLASASSDLEEAKAGGDAEEIEEAQEAYDKLAKSLSEKLSPAQVQLAKQALDVRDAWEEMSKSAGRKFFDEAQFGAQSLIGAFGQLQPYILQISRSMGGFFGAIGEELTTPESLDSLRFGLQSMSVILQEMERPMQNMVEGFMNLSNAAQPLFHELVENFKLAALSFREWTSDTDNLMERFAEGEQTVSSFWQIVKNTALALQGTFDALSEEAGWLWDGMERLTDQWNTWTRSVEGKNAIAEWGAEARPILSALGGLIADIWNLFGDLDGSNTLVNVINILREDFVPAIERVLNASSNSGLLEELAGALGSLLTVVSTVAGNSGVLTSFASLLSDILVTVGNLVDSVPWLGSSIANLATSFGLLYRVTGKAGISGTLGLILTLSQELTGDLRLAAGAIAAFGAAWAAIKIAGFASQMRGLGDLTTGLGTIALNAGQKIGSSGLAGALSGAMNPAVIGVTAAVTAGVMVWQAWSTNVNRTREEVNKFVTDVSEGADVIERGMSQLNNILDTRESFRDSFQDAGLNVGQVTRLIDENAGAFDDARAIWHESGELWDMSAAKGENFKDRLDELNPTVRRFYEDLQRQVDAGDLLPNQMREIIDATAETDIAFISSAENLENLIQSYDEAAKGSAQYADIQARLAAIENADSESERLRLIKELGAAYPELKRDVGDYIDTSKEENELLEQKRGKYDEVEEALKTYHESLRQTATDARTNRELQEELAESSSKVRAEFEMNGSTLDANSEKGRKNADAIRDLYDRYVDFGAALIENGASVEDTTNVWSAFEAELGNLLGNGEAAKTVVAELGTQLGLTEGTYIAEMKLSMEQENLLRLSLLKDHLEFLSLEDFDAIVDAAVTGDINGFDSLVSEAKWMDDNPRHEQEYTLQERRIITESWGSRLTAQAEAAGVSGGRTKMQRNPDGTVSYVPFAEGGMSENHVAQIAPAGAWRVWAEPETGGEAYIPLAQSKRKRSMEIWEETGRRLGAYQHEGHWQMADGGVLDKISPILTTLRNRNMSNRVPPPPGTGTTARLANMYGPVPDSKSITTEITRAVAAPMGAAFQGLAKAVGDIKGLSATTMRMVQAVKAVVPDMRVSSGLRNSKVAGTNRTSRHAYGKAADMVASGPGMERIYQFLKANWSGLNMYSAIWQHRISSSRGFDRNYGKNDHFDHVHGSTNSDGAIYLGKGGIVTRPTRAIIGEAGPEAVVPLSRGGIVSMANGGTLQSLAARGVTEEQFNAALNKFNYFWEKLVSEAERSDPMKAIQAIMGRLQKTEMYTSEWEQLVNRAVGIQKRLQENQKDYELAQVEKDDPLKAIGLVMQSMKGLGVWTDEWVQKRNKVNQLQERIAQDEEQKRQNKWNYTFEKADDAVKLRMAMEARSTMEAWTNEWVQMTKRIEDLQNTGPAVVIQEAVFKDETDLELLDRHVEFRVKTQR